MYNNILIVYLSRKLRLTSRNRYLFTKKKSLSVCRSLIGIFFLTIINTMNKHEKFLEFNGKNIIFLNVDGHYYIALKPICEALNVDYIRCFKNVKNDPILAPVLSVQAMQVSKNGKNQLRNVTCIPEKFIYGWLFSLRSDSAELIDYKKTCYELLYNHFHGTITNRKELLLSRDELDTKIHNMKTSLQEKDLAYKELQNLETERKKVNTLLNSMDKEIVNQPGFWN